jgi:PAS domain S-box-containing protein
MRFPASASFEPGQSQGVLDEPTRLLLGIAQELSRLSDREAIMTTVRQGIRKLTGADGSTIVLKQGDEVFYADEDAIEPLWKGQRFAASSCISGWSILNRKIAVIEDIYADPRIPVEAYSKTFVKSLVMAPIRSEDPIGAIGAYWRERRRATPREIAHLQALAELTAIAFANASLVEDLRNEVRQHTEAEERLRQSEARFRTAVESAPNAMVMIDDRGRIVLANAQAEKLFGYPREELLGGTIEMLVPERFRGAHPGYRKQFFHEPRSRAMGAGRDLFGRRKDGSEIPVEIGLNPIRTEEGHFVLAAIVDISERKRAEERFRVAVEGAPNAMVMINPEGSIILVNAQTEALFGYSREELLGNTIEILVPERFRTNHPKYRKDFFACPRARAMGAGRDLFGLKKDGTEIPVEIGLNPFTTDEGTFVLAAIVDITERKRAEGALKKTAEDLSRSNKELQQFAYVASHDLQEPLRAVAGCVDLLRQRYKGRFEGPADELMGHAVDGAMRMQTLINDLLAYSRVDTRGGSLERIDSGKALEAALSNLEVAISEKQARITHDAMPTIVADQTQLTQLFQNLIGNAIKFRSERLLAVHVGAQRGQDEWIFSVRDNGIGIEPEYYERIFQIFQRLHTQGRYPGTGIGLAICKKIVDRHGGRIWVESKAGEGSTFFFTLPTTTPRYV